MYWSLFLSSFSSLILPLVVMSRKPCKGTATYTLSFQGDWINTDTSPRPSGAHFSGLIACSHNHCYEMFKSNRMASAGVKDVAEKGDPSKLNKEIQKHLEKENAVILESVSSKTKWIGPESFYSFRPVNETCGGFRVDAGHPLVSVIVGIVPSPDWFTGVEDLDLCDNSTGKWRNQEKIFPNPFDAGTDSGTDFNSYDTPTVPRKRISRWDRAVTYNNRTRLPGYFLFTLCKTFPFSKDRKTLADYECGASTTKWTTVLLAFSVLIPVFF